MRSRWMMLMLFRLEARKLALESQNQVGKISSNKVLFQNFHSSNSSRKPKTLAKSTINSAFKMGWFGNWPNSSLPGSRDSRKRPDFARTARRRKDFEKGKAEESRKHTKNWKDQKENQQVGSRMRADQLGNWPERVVRWWRHGICAILKILNEAWYFAFFKNLKICKYIFHEIIIDFIQTQKSFWVTRSAGHVYSPSWFPIAGS